MKNKKRSISQTDSSSNSSASFVAPLHPLFAVFTLLFAATMWGFIWYPLRLFAAQGVTGAWASALMYCGTMLIALPVLVKGWHELKQSPWLFLFMALATGWTNISFILAVLDGNVVRVVLLFYLSPLWATLLGFLFLGEQLSRRSLLILAIAMAGAVIMLWRESMAFPAPRDLSDWLALSSGIAFAITNVLIHKLDTASVMVKTAAGWVGVLILAFTLILFTDQPLQGSATLIAKIILLGLFVMALANVAVVYGVSHMPVHRSAIILLFEVVVSAISSIILTDEIIQLHEWTGGLLVILAAYLTATSQVEHRITS